MKMCSVCGWQRASRKGRCASCAQWRRRHGRDRTPEEVMVAYERVLDLLAKKLS